jgi:MFS family permease
MSTPTATAGPGRAAGGADPRRWVALAVVLIAGFMQLVDISIVNVAIPSIQRDLDATYAEIQWVLAGYQLAFAVMLITGGRLGDIFGRKGRTLVCHLTRAAAGCPRCARCRATVGTADLLWAAGSPQPSR